MFYTESIPKYRSAEQINTAMSRVYANMGLAVATSMLISWLVGSSPDLMAFFFTGITKWVVIFAPLAFIFIVPAVLNSGVSAIGAHLLLHSFAAVMGLSFATIFTIYSTGSIISAFMGGAVLFGVMSIYGYFTKRSLDSLGKWLFVGLIAIIIASIINIFVGSSAAQMAISTLAILIFTGLTAYDTQKIREQLSTDGDHVAEVSGALTLYLDFINLFLSLLQLLGGKKE